MAFALSSLMSTAFAPMHLQTFQPRVSMTPRDLNPDGQIELLLLDRSPVCFCRMATGTMQIRAAVDPSLLELPLTLLSAAAKDLSILGAADEVARTTVHLSQATLEQATLNGMSLLLILMVGPLAMSMLFPKADVTEDEAESDWRSSSFTDVPTTVEPGWLTCDMRVPLPAYPDLENACHLINTING